MILYVNGDSHSAAAEAAVEYNSGGEDPEYSHLGRAAHPENAKVSYAKHLADRIGAKLYLDAVSGSSNRRIIRTTREFVNAHPNEDIFVLIGWAVVSREEVYVNDQFHCLSANMQVTENMESVFKEWILSYNMSSRDKAITSHHNIRQLHNFLKEKNVKHLFFNTVSMGWDEEMRMHERIDWGKHYLHPYSGEFGYGWYLNKHGYKPRKWPGKPLTSGDHYGPDAHLRWAEFLLPYIQSQ